MRDPVFILGIMDQLTITHPAETTCSRCGDVVLRVRGMLLTRTPVVGGLYELTGEPERLQPRRRRFHQMAEEFSTRHRVHGGGYDVHVCADHEESWTDR